MKATCDDYYCINPRPLLASRLRRERRDRAVRSMPYGRSTNSQWKRKKP